MRCGFSGLCFRTFARLRQYICMKKISRYICQPLRCHIIQLKLSPTWSCGSLPRPTTSSEHNLPWYTQSESTHFVNVANVLLIYHSFFSRTNSTTLGVISACAHLKLWLATATHNFSEHNLPWYTQSESTHFANVANVLLIYNAFFQGQNGRL